MVPDHSFFQAMSSCLVAILPDKFYDMVDKGSIVLKKAKNFSFCKEGVTVEGESAPIKSDVVIFATGYKGDQKLKDIFTSSLFRDIVAGSPSSIIPLYRFNLSFSQKQLFRCSYADAHKSQWFFMNWAGNVYILGSHNWRSSAILRV